MVIMMAMAVSAPARAAAAQDRALRADRGGPLAGPAPPLRLDVLVMAGTGLVALVEVA